MNSKITFPELIDLVAQATNTSKRMSELFLKELFATVSQALIDGESVKIKNLGQFKVEEVKPRKSVSVNTGQEVEIPSHNRITFTPAKSLADAINEPFAHFETVVLHDDLTDEQLNALDTETPPAVETPVEPAAPAVESLDTIETQEATPATDEAAPEQLLPPPFTPPVEPLAESPAEEPLGEPQDAEPEPAEPTEPVADTIDTVDTVDTVDTIVTVDPSPSEEPAPIDPSPEPEEEYGQDYEDYEHEMHEIARRSTIKGIIYGAIGMLVSIALIAGGYFAMTYEPQRVVEPAKEEPYVPADSTHNATADTTAQVVKPAQPQVVTDTCQTGKFLTRIARIHYGSNHFWVYIYEENKDKIANPNTIAPGTVVVIPPAEKYGIDANDPESIKRAKKKSWEILSKFPSNRKK